MRALLYFLLILLVVIVSGCSFEAVESADEFHSGLYKGPIGTNYGAPIVRVGKHARLELEFYECDGSQCADATVHGFVSAAGNELVGTTTMLDLLLIGEDDIEGELVYGVNDDGEDKILNVSGKFGEGHTTFEAKIAGALGDIDLKIVEDEEETEDADSELSV